MEMRLTDTSPWSDYAWSLLTDNWGDDKNLSAAFRYSERATNLAKGENPFFLDTLALAHFKYADYAAAVETQRRAISLIRSTSEDERVIADFERRLESYVSELK